MAESFAATRLLASNLHDTALTPIDSDDPLSTRSARLAAVGDVEVGLWEVDPGDGVDVETDEVFVVLSGLGTITFSDGSTIALRPGVVVHLHTGDRTQWQVVERLRKLYLT